MTLRRAMSAIIPMIYFSILAGSPPMVIAQERTEPEARTYLLETVDDAAVVQVYADAFKDLPLDQKKLVWHLYQAAIAARDIYFDQRHAQSLDIRDLIEAVVVLPDAAPEPVRSKIVRYTKLFWLNTGPYHNLTARKFTLDCSKAELLEAVKKAAARGAALPLRKQESIDQLVDRLAPMIFDPTFQPIVTNKSPGAGKDILVESANNLYVGVSMKDLDGFQEKFSLNSRLVKRDGQLVEEPYKLGGLYTLQIQAVIGHLEAAVKVAPSATAKALQALIRVYQTAEEADRVAYDIAWVQDKEALVDTINYFTEVYLDARGKKGGHEAIVSFVNPSKTASIKKIAAQAAFFEANMPTDAKFRKPDVKGITANAIDVVIETGDAGPVTPIGINLPNDQAIREQHGSKSVSLSNIIEAYEKSTPSGLRTEFTWSADEASRNEKFGGLAQDLTVNMHEVIGHASGRVSDRLAGKPQDVLKEQYSALEEARADLVALYFIADPKMVELGLVKAAEHKDVVLAEYEYYTRNALVQLRRVRSGDQLEEDHMRNRQMIVRWLMANSKAIEIRQRGGKTYFVMVNPKAFREGVAQLLAEVQRIKSEGDYNAAKVLFETHGIHFDPKLRDEVLARVNKLKLPAYTGFVMPRLEPVKDTVGQITDIRIEYPRDLTRQMLEYSAVGRAIRQYVVKP
ncbi:MAG: peptidase M49 [Planctomycetota bacterium]|nr:peptidase M49 [Planctomycetota bacterium]